MRYDGTGVDASGGYPIIDKEGWYPFRITLATPGESKKSGNYQVTVDAVCLAPQWRDYPVRHWVTFMPKEQKGAGIALHFLKCIGQPYEGVIDVNPMAWERATFMGKVVINEYEGKKNNKFAEISPVKDDTGIEFGEPTPSQKTAFEE